MKSSTVAYTLIVVIGLLSLVESSLLQRVYSQYIQQKTCSIEDYPGVIDECNVDAENGQFPTGSQCRVVEPDKETTYEVDCINGQWIKPNSVTRTHGHRQKRFLILIIIFCIIFCPRGEAANEPPTFTNCPTIKETMKADRGSITAKVSWDDPKATDPDGDEVTISQIRGDSKGSSFQEGKHHITYEAEDSKGNKGYCAMEFTVTVKRCYPLEWPKNGRKHCTGADIWGTTCTFTCYEGYEVEGANSATCEADGHYSDAVPMCTPVKCPIPEEPENGEAVCSRSDYRFRSICVTQCTYGYRAAVLGMSECLGNKEWSSPLSTCQDVQPPTLTCPSVIKGYTDRSSNTATVTWDEPIATDNSGDVVVELLNANYGPGSLFLVGCTIVMYQAIDGAGNTSPICTVAVDVESIKCTPPSFKDDNLHSECNSKSLYQWGSSCSLSCLHGLSLEGSENITCERVDNTTHAEWVWEEEPSCEHKCPDLDPPLNGTLACDTSREFTFCVPMCNREYDISSRAEEDTIYVCGDNKIWTPSNNVPDCSKKRKPGKMILPSEIYYYNGSCGGEVANEEIKNAFLEIVLEHQQSGTWVNLCTLISCDIENVDIHCGSINRRKRDVEMLDANKKRTTKKDAEATYIITFSIAANVGEQTINMDYINKTETALLGLATVMDEAVKAGAFDISGMELRGESFASEDLAEWGCPYGQVSEMAKFYDAFCVGCPVGTYYDGQNDCLSCPKGTYRDTEDTFNCTVCPEGTWTSATGVVNASQCIDFCVAGTYSPTGLAPCSPCPSGEYQFETMAQSCSVCSPGKTTKTASSTTVSECLDFDMLLHRFSKIYVDSFSDAEVTDVTVIAWMYWTVSTGYMDISLGDHMLMNYSAQSVFVSIGNESMETTVSTLSEEWTHVAVRISLTSGNTTVFVKGELVDLENSFPSLSTNISVSHLELWYHGPEKTGVQISGFNVITSLLTDHDIRMMSLSCNSVDTNAYVTMSDLIRGTNRNADLVIPTHCDEYDDCKDRPCGNHICKNAQNGYTCHCSGGFTGDHCEIPPNYCINNTCQNGATCVNAESHYSCSCLPGYSGEMCQNAPVNGQLSTWTDWTGCSVSCGGGNMTRERDCNSPPPDDFGAPCQGHTREYEYCNTNECPTCTELDRPYASFLTCDDVAGMTYCNLTCRDGYTFPPGHEPKQLYYCGIETNYEWQHTTNDNPSGDLPGCSEISSSNSLTTRTQATYKDFPCRKEDDAKKKITENLAGLPCVHNATCTLDIVISGCENTTRERRQIGTPVVSVSLTVPIDDGDLDLSAFFENNTISGTLAQIIQATEQLETSAQTLQNNTESYLDTVVDGAIYRVETDTVTTTPTIGCPPGSVASEVFCVKCTPGTFYDAGQCKMCEKGTYQDQFGQSSCIHCPDPFTTLGKGSASLLRCNTFITKETAQMPTSTSLQTTSDENDSVLEIALLVLCCSIGGVVLLLGICCLIREKTRKTATYNFPNLGLVQPTIAYLSFCSRDSSESETGRFQVYKETCYETKPDLGNARSLNSESGTRDLAELH